jgi:hypothetical protein
MHCDQAQTTANGWEAWILSAGSVSARIGSRRLANCREVSHLQPEALCACSRRSRAIRADSDCNGTRNGTRGRASLSAVERNRY